MHYGLKTLTKFVEKTFIVIQKYINKDHFIGYLEKNRSKEEK